MNEIKIDLKYVRHYANRKNLQNFLKKTGLGEFTHLQIQTEENRWTAIFRLKSEESWVMGSVVQYFKCI